ncbi:MAG TPA: RidA family protein [Candidatus Stackebrandtia excrementipullorum]|nr:RidA family protein [Candidatus Stackebrandtia excrementipullorum]
MSVESRLAELGFPVPAARPPVGAYLPASRAGTIAMSSGQLPMGPEGILATGKVGSAPGSVDPETAGQCAVQATLIALAALRTVVGELDRIDRIMKLTGYVASDPDFTGQPGVIDHASRLLVEAFGEPGRHARAALGVAVLPLNSPVEVELTVSVRDDG